MISHYIIKKVMSSILTLQLTNNSLDIFWTTYEKNVKILIN
jgi:glucose-6-phosphate 1-dehydrogenase